VTAGTRPYGSTVSATAIGADHVVRLCDAIRTKDDSTLTRVLSDAKIDAPDDPLAAAFRHLAAALNDAPLAERVVPALLMLGSLPPATVAGHRPTLRAIVGALPPDGVRDAEHSPRPHVRAGAVVANGLLAGDGPIPEDAIAERLDARPAETEPDDVARITALWSDDASVVAGALLDVGTWPPATALALLWTTLPDLADDAAAIAAERIREIDERALSLLTRSAIARGGECDLLRATSALSVLSDASEPLVDALSHPSTPVRLRALRALARRDGALDAIGSRVRDAAPEVRHEAVGVLAMRKDPNGAVHLLDASADPVPSIAAAARAALRRLASSALIEQLVDALDDAERSAAAADVLTELAEHARGSLLERIGDSTGLARERMVQILRRTGAERRLVELLDDPHPIARSRAAEAIAALDGPNAATTLRPLLHDPEPELRARVAALIAETGDTSVADELSIVYLEEPDPRVRDAITDALRQLKRTDTHAAQGSTGPIGGRT